MSKDDEKLEFLYHAISDAQDIIRFVDAKTGVGVTVIFAYSAFLASTFQTLVLHHFGMLTWSIFVYSFLLIILSLITVALVIIPTSNPVGSVMKNDDTMIPSLFFLGDNGENVSQELKYLFKKSHRKGHGYRLNSRLENYVLLLQMSSSSDLVKTLSFELHKISFIRNLKNDRFNLFVRLLILLSISFLIFLVYYEYRLALLTKYKLN